MVQIQEIHSPKAPRSKEKGRPSTRIEIGNNNKKTHVPSTAETKDGTGCRDIGLCNGCTKGYCCKNKRKGAKATEENIATDEKGKAKKRDKENVNHENTEDKCAEKIADHIRRSTAELVLFFDRQGNKNGPRAGTRPRVEQRKARDASLAKSEKLLRTECDSNKEQKSKSAKEVVQRPKSAHDIKNKSLKNSTKEQRAKGKLMKKQSGAPKKLMNETFHNKSERTNKDHLNSVRNKSPEDVDVHKKKEVASALDKNGKEKNSIGKVSHNVTSRKNEGMSKIRSRKNTKLATMHTKRRLQTPSNTNKTKTGKQIKVEKCSEMETFKCNSEHEKCVQKDKKENSPFSTNANFETKTYGPQNRVKNISSRLSLCSLAIAFNKLNKKWAANSSKTNATSEKNMKPEEGTTRTVNKAHQKKTSSRNNSANRKERGNQDLNTFKPWSKYREVKTTDQKQRVIDELVQKFEDKRTKIPSKPANNSAKKMNQTQASGKDDSLKGPNESPNSTKNNYLKHTSLPARQSPLKNQTKTRGKETETKLVTVNNNKHIDDSRPVRQVVPRGRITSAPPHLATNLNASANQHGKHQILQSNSPAKTESPPRHFTPHNSPIRPFGPQAPKSAAGNMHSPNFDRSAAHRPMLGRQPVPILNNSPAKNKMHPLDNVHNTINYPGPTNMTAMRRSITELSKLFGKLKQPPRKGELSQKRVPQTSASPVQKRNTRGQIQGQGQGQVQSCVDSTELMQHFSKLAQQKQKRRFIPSPKTPRGQVKQKSSQKSPKSITDLVKLFDPSSKPKRKVDTSKGTRSQNQSPNATGMLNISASASTASKRRDEMAKKKKGKKKGGGKKKGKKGSKKGDKKGAKKGDKKGAKTGGDMGGPRRGPGSPPRGAPRGPKGKRASKSKRDVNFNPRKGMKKDGRNKIPGKKGKRGSKSSDGSCKRKCCKKRRPCRPCPDTVKVLSDLQGLKERVASVAAKTTPLVQQNIADIVPADECARPCAKPCCQRQRGFCRCGECRSVDSGISKKNNEAFNDSNSSEQNSSSNRKDDEVTGRGSCGRCGKTFKYSSGVDEEGHLSSYVYDLVVALCGRRIEEAMIRVIPAARDRMLDICTGCGKPYFTGRCCPARAPGQCCCNGASLPCGDCKTPCFDPMPPCCCEPSCGPPCGGGGCGGGMGAMWSTQMASMPPTMGYPRLLSNPGDFARERVFQALQGKIQKILYKNMLKG